MTSNDMIIPDTTCGDFRGAHVGGVVGAKMQSAAKSIPGIGETSHGSANTAVDSVRGDKEGVHKNQRIAKKGAAEMYQRRTAGGSGAAYPGPGSGLGNVGR